MKLSFNKRLYVDCSGVEPVVTTYPDLPIVAGNRVECSGVFEARNNESNKVEFVVSCMDQSMYFVAFDSITEINIAVIFIPNRSYIGTNPRTCHCSHSFGQQ